MKSETHPQETAPRKLICGWNGLIKSGYNNGKGRCQLWRDVRAGIFPAPIVTGPRGIAWYEDELIAHRESLQRRTYRDKVAA